MSFAFPKDNLEYGLVAAFALAMLVALLGKSIWESIVELTTLARMTHEHRRWRMRVFQSNYGRDGGWYVELDGRRIALLTDQCFEQMFWDNCALTPLVEDPTERERLMSDSKWWHQTDLKFRSREFDVYTDYAFASGNVFSATGRVSMRGLYIHILPHMTSWEEYWVRRARSRDKRTQSHHESVR